MPNYLRSRVEGAIYFFTIVTEGRRPILGQPWARALLGDTIRLEQTLHPWETLAIVLMPDHIHTLWRLNDGDTDYSSRIGRIKASFSKAFLAEGGTSNAVSAGKVNKRDAGVWQPRFWEHTIRDAKDFKMHLDYIHGNPVKHGLVSWPKDWPWSSFHRYRRMGEYAEDWCGNVDMPGQVEYYWNG